MKKTPLNSFSGLKKHHQSNNVINEIERDKKEICSTSCDISGEMCKFYKTLYNSNSIPGNEVNSYLGDCEIKALIKMKW